MKVLFNFTAIGVILEQEATELHILSCAKYILFSPYYFVNLENSDGYDESKISNPYEKVKRWLLIFTDRHFRFKNFSELIHRCLSFSKGSSVRVIFLNPILDPPQFIHFQIPLQSRYND